ncbi:MAG: Ppx/GppA family phosphatase [Propionibacteriaceae bacterium]|jgi:exopolyphosphatase/guanosine-5'-triphosphate,3'-diphosphate pyrophosphatase|nr:Ppx/GppA family phosphatase [Propionibacteriaceae bacterium]
MNDLYAAVDCGTNSVRLLLARVIGGRVAEVDRRLHITRLGQGVDQTGEFHPDALARTFAAFADFAAQVESCGGALTRVVATSAARDAKNSAEFFAAAKASFGVDAEIISGGEEAELSFRGALAGLPGIPEPVLVMDVGGGSTELALGDSAQLSGAVSLDIGSVRLRERFLTSDPPTPAQLGRATDFVNGLLDASGIAFGQAKSWVGVGGTATCLAALSLRLPVYDSAQVHASRLESPTLGELAQRLSQLPVAQVRSLPAMVPGRADVICAGALICREVSRRVGLPLTVSESDILDGIVLGMASAAG